jgi:hypothetical protein
MGGAGRQSSRMSWKLEGSYATYDHCRALKSALSTSHFAWTA